METSRIRAEDTYKEQIRTMLWYASGHTVICRNKSSYASNHYDGAYAAYNINNDELPLSFDWDNFVYEIKFKDIPEWFTPLPFRTSATNVTGYPVILELSKDRDTAWRIIENPNEGDEWLISSEYGNIFFAPTNVDPADMLLSRKLEAFGMNSIYYYNNRKLAEFALKHGISKYLSENQAILKDSGKGDIQARLDKYTTKVLELSTAFITPRDAELMVQPRAPLIDAKSEDSDGCVYIWVPGLSEMNDGPFHEHEKRLKDFGFSEYYINIIATCRANRIPRICISPHVEIESEFVFENIAHLWD